MNLKEDPSVTLEVFADQDENLMGIFYQDNSIMQLYAAFPEVLFVDATHKVNELRMPLYIFLVCDGNGQSEIVAAFLVASEQKPVIEQMVRIFKKHNTSWSATRVIMTDKDMMKETHFLKNSLMLYFNCAYFMYSKLLEGKLPQKPCQLEVLREVLFWIYFKN